MNGHSDSIRVTIFGKEYSIRGESDAEYVKSLAAHVDSVMREIADSAGVMASGRIAILAALNIADEMHKERRSVDDFASRMAEELKKVLETE